MSQEIIAEIMRKSNKRKEKRGMKKIKRKKQRIMMVMNSRISYL
jgi:hypothetical protein